MHLKRLKNDKEKEHLKRKKKARLSSVTGAVLVTDYFYLQQSVVTCKEKKKVEIIEYKYSVSIQLTFFFLFCPSMSDVDL